MDKILRHIQWHPGEPLIPYIRPPPFIDEDMIIAAVRGEDGVPTVRRYRLTR